jgi:hypothetical protein
MGILCAVIFSFFNNFRFVVIFFALGETLPGRESAMERERAPWRGRERQGEGERAPGRGRQREREGRGIKSAHERMRDRKDGYDRARAREV